jgi:glycogen debranching enzyme
MMDMLDAAAAFKYRLPETFAGYKRGKMTFPVRYPSSCSPQAWASGTPLLFVRTLLGLQPDVFNKTLLIEPHFPESLTDFSMECIPAFAKHFSIRGEGGRFEISQSCTCRKSG